MKLNYAVTKEIDRLIYDGITSYKELDEIDRDILTSLCIDSLGRDSFECVVETNEPDDIMHALKTFMKKGSLTNAHDLAETIREAAVNYFSFTLDILFSERFDVFQYDTKIENGLKPIQHKDNGEITWMHA